MLYFIGLGLENSDLSEKALKALKKCDTLYFETYTSLGIDVGKLSLKIKKNITLVDRDFVEQGSEKLLQEAKKRNVGLLVQGDCLSATTHSGLLLECKQKNIPCEIIHGISILTAVANTGLSLYHFGKTASIPFQKNVKTPYLVLQQNLEHGMHTLFLLDLDPKHKKFLSVPEALHYLLEQGMENRLCVGCMQLGTAKEIIKVGKARDLLKENFNIHPQCLIVTGKMHFIEEDFLKMF